MSDARVAIRDAATILVIRDRATDPAVLMGRRGRGAVFMPGKMVFPGGAVDPGDADAAFATPVPAPCRHRLGDRADALAAAALRELREETGQIAGRREMPGARAAAGRSLHAGGLRYVFRAITPPGRPRRFDARFFTLDAADLAGDPDDFTAASGELCHLRWVPIGEARDLDLPFITAIVLAEVAARLPALDAPDRIPFFHADPRPTEIADAALAAAPSAPPTSRPIAASSAIARGRSR